MAFDDLSSEYQLVDDRGCSDEKIISQFEYDDGEGLATARIFKMFRLPRANQTHFQCEVAICRGVCALPDCSGEDGEDRAAQAATLTQPRPEDDAVTTSTSVFVAAPGSEEACKEERDSDGLEPGSEPEEFFCGRGSSCQYFEPYLLTSSDKILK